MEKFIWLFPIIFIFHDMEEIIGLSIWFGKNKGMLSEKYPRFFKDCDDFCTEEFAVAVFEELIVCILFCVFAFLSEVGKFLWLGGLIACVLHFVVHIVQSIVLRKYIPALATSVLCLPVGVFIVIESFLLLGGDFFKTAIWGFIGVVTVVVNLIFAKWLGKKIICKVMNKD